MKTYLISGYSMFPPANIVYKTVTAKNKREAVKQVKHVAILKVKEIS